MDSGSDAERRERKRVLGVLAQRRYRQRKNERQRILETDLANARANERNVLPHVTTSVNDGVSTPLEGLEWIGEQGSVDASVGYIDAEFDPDFFEIFLQDPTMPSNQASDSGPISPQATPQNFVDDHTLRVPELEVLNTAYVFAKLLQCEDSLWSPLASRTLDLTPSETSTLPIALRPTIAQRQIPHHPILDILPWPSVRAKLIYVFHQPLEQRPPIARDGMALLRLTYDMDDSAEGLKVHGSDRLDAKNWEVGQQLFDNWWWAFDNSVILASNTLRLKRGATRLRIPST